MVEVKIVEDEKEQKVSGEESGEDMQTASEARADQEDHEEEDIPLKKMTKPQLIEKIKEIQEEVDRNYDLYVRSRAENDNLRKRFQKEKEDLARYANESLIKQLLPVVDNLEKAMAHLQEDKPSSALAEGVELTLKGMLDTLKRNGVEEVKAVGEPFDPSFHEAVSGQPDDTVAPGTVLQELQKGYILNERLIRPAMVIVSKGDN